MKQSRRGLRQQIDSAMFFELEKFPAEDPVRGLGQGVPRMTAAASLHDSSSVLVADLGKGRVMPQVKDLPVYPSRCIPPRKRGLPPMPLRKQGALAPPSKRPAVEQGVFLTPCHFCTAQRDRRAGHKSGFYKESKRLLIRCVLPFLFENRTRLINDIAHKILAASSILLKKLLDRDDFSSLRIVIRLFRF